MISNVHMVMVKCKLRIMFVAQSTYNLLQLYIIYNCFLFFPQADYEQYYIIFSPTHCSNPESCQGTNIHPVVTAGNFNYKDYQEIKIQVCYICFSFAVFEYVTHDFKCIPWHETVTDHMA